MKSSCWSIQVLVCGFFSDASLTPVLAVAGRRHVSALVCPALSEDEGVLTVFPFAKAYHVSNDEHTIATADCGGDATVEIWSAQRSSPHPRISVSGI